MTNEQLAEFIQQGGSDDLKPVLWERVKKLYCMLSHRYFKTNYKVCLKAGIDEFDLKQLCYLAYQRALDSFKPKRAFLFTAYAQYSLRYVLRPIVQTKNPLNESISINTSFGSEDENDIDLIETIPDADALASFEQVELSDVQRIVRCAVERLSDEQRQVVKSYYFEGKTYAETALAVGKSPAQVHQIGIKARQTLRRNGELCRLAEAYGYNSRRLYRNSVSGFARSGITNVEWVAIARADLAAEINAYWDAYKKLHCSNTGQGMPVENC